MMTIINPEKESHHYTRRVGKRATYLDRVNKTWTRMLMMMKSTNVTELEEEDADDDDNQA